MAATVFSLLAWLGVWAFWLAVTHNAHPTFALALVVTTSLIAAYAMAASINHLILVPRFWSVGHRGRYTLWLLATMSILTAVALAIIRFAYRSWFGPDPDPNGVYKHYAIDLFGMFVHVGAAAMVVRLARGIDLMKSRPTS